MNNNNLAVIEVQERSLALETSRFELEQRRAKALAMSRFFPADMKNDIGSAIIIYDLARRMNISEMEVSQNIYIIYGRPSFSTIFITARLNQSGLIKGPLKTIVSSDKQSAYCTAIDVATGEELAGMTITMAIAKAEGWLSKKGSKWVTMPELMLRKRAQSFFIKEFYPQVMFGLSTDDEIRDIVETEVAQPTTDINQAIMQQSTPQEPQTFDAEIEEVAEQVHGEADEMQPQKRSRRTKAEIEAILAEANRYRPDGIAEYTKLRDVPKQEEREAIARLEAPQAESTPSYGEVDTTPIEPLNVNSALAQGSTPTRQHNKLPYYITNNWNKVEKVGLSVQEFQGFIEYHIPNWETIPHSELRGRAGEIFGADSAQLRAMVVEFYQRAGMQVPPMPTEANPLDDMPKAIADKLQFFINNGLNADDYPGFIKFSNLNEDTIRFVEEDVAWTLSLIEEWNAQ